MPSPDAGAPPAGTRMAVVGVGYTGLPLALALGAAGYRVYAVDVDPQRVARLRSGEPGVETADGPTLRRMLAANAFTPTVDCDVIAECDVVIIAVPTPLRAGEPDLSAVRRAAADVAAHARRGALVVLESTSYPGTAREVVLPYLSERMGTAGRDFCLAVVPERIDPGNTAYSLATTPRIAGGVTGPCAERAAALYRKITAGVETTSSMEAAEAAKLFENAFRNVNIAFANEMGFLCEHLGLDAREIVRAAASKPFGFMPFYPGPGIGGECIPVDPRYLAWFARRKGQAMHLLECAMDLNEAMPDRTVSRIALALNESGRALRGANILALGVSYKPEVGDMRNAPALKVIGRLVERGAKVSYHDRHVPEVQIGDMPLRSVEPDAKTLQRCDLAVVLVAHAGVDYRLIGRQTRLLDLSSGPALPLAASGDASS